jgi:hypothetical protein
MTDGDRLKRVFAPYLCRSLVLNLECHLPTGDYGPLWTAEQLQLLGTEPDDVVAARTGRTANAVRQKRYALGIANPHDRRVKA